MGKLQQKILHDDRKALSAWLMAQHRYMGLETTHLREKSWQELGVVDLLRRSYVIAPLAMLLYCLFVKRGILDGKAGLFYAMQRAVAELILSLRLLEADVSLQKK